jgi:hypothetical protein
MWPVTLSAIPVTPQSPKLYRLFASGTSTTAASARHVHAGRADREREHEPAVRCGLRCPDAGQLRYGGAVAVLRGRVHPPVQHHGRRGRDVRVQPFRHGRRRRPGLATGNAIFGGISASTDFTLTTNGPVDGRDARHVDDEYVGAAARRVGFLV